MATIELTENREGTDIIINAWSALTENLTDRGTEDNF
jgi:hypothetical protein